MPHRLRIAVRPRRKQQYATLNPFALKPELARLPKTSYPSSNHSSLEYAMGEGKKIATATGAGAGVGAIAGGAAGTSLGVAGTFGAIAATVPLAVVGGLIVGPLCGLGVAGYFLYQHNTRKK